MKKYFQAPWSFKDLILISLFSILLLGLYSALLYYVDLKGYLQHANLKSLYLFGILIVQWLVVLLPLLVFTLKKYKFKWEHFGFRAVGILKTIGLVLSSYFLYLGITIIISLIIVYYNLHIPGYQLQESILPLFGTDLLSLIVAAVAILIFAPVIEELVFRGFLLRALVNKIGVTWGSIFSALIFSLLHVPWQSLIPIFILGLIVNSVVIKSKSIWPAIIFHFFNNSITFTVQLLIEKEIIKLV